MKPGFNHQTLKGGVREWEWRYYERKIGWYLNLRTPLQNTDKYCWWTRVKFEPRGVFSVQRETWELHGTLRARGYRWYTCVSLHVLPEYKTEYVLVGETDDGDEIHYGRRGPLIRANCLVGKRCTWGTFIEPKSQDVASPEEVLTVHERMNPILAGCRATGEWRPFVDWCVENVPLVSDLFTGEGRT